jgi:hypothetical protein
MRVVVTAVTFLIMGTLAISLIGKIRSRAAFSEFAAAVAGLRVVPEGWATAVAVGSVASEVFVLLLLPVGPAAGLAAAAVLFAGFTTALALAIRRGARVACHCFGASQTPVAPRHVLRSGLLTALACGASVYSLAAAAPSLGGIEPPQMLVAVTAAGIAVVALVRLDDLVWLFRGTTSTARRSE